jgi:hypothetical protein
LLAEVFNEAPRRSSCDAIAEAVKALLSLYQQEGVFAASERDHTHVYVTQGFLGPGDAEYWREDQAELFDALAPVWRDWFAMFGGAWGSTTALIYRLLLPAARNRRLAFLELITPDHVDRDADARPALRHLLERCWHDQRVEIESSPETRITFHALLQHLVNRGDQRAAMLQDRVRNS